jgi:hypothetical protein
VVTRAETVLGKQGRAPKRMQPTALSRALLLVVSFLGIFSSISAVVSAMRRLMRHSFSPLSNRDLRVLIMVVCNDLVKCAI